MWIFYEHPEVNFDDLKQKFMDIRKRAFKYPELGRKSKLICIPTTSGTGSEVSPFAVISDKAAGKKYPLTDYSLTPSIAIVDPEFTTNLPAKATAETGMDVLTHAIEAYTSVMASDYTDGLALEAIKLVFAYLPRAVKDGKNDLEAREKMHNAATIAGMVNYINSIWDLVYNSGTTSLLEATLDVAEFLRFSAVSQLFGNPDDQRYNANNYYIYFLPSSGKAVYIPYDWDWSLGLDWSDDHGMASKTALDESKLTNNSPNVYYATFFVSGSTAYSKVSYRNAYLSAIASALADGLLDFSSYAALSGKMKYATDGEYSLVSSFMAAHKAVLS